MGLTIGDDRKLITFLKKAIEIMNSEEQKEKTLKEIKIEQYKKG